MIFVTGPLFAGKRETIRGLLGLTEEEFAACAAWDVQERALEAEPEILAEELSANRVVIATEVGGGVVPVDPEMRAWREATGRMMNELCRHADRVVRLFCGIPQVLK